MKVKIPIIKISTNLIYKGIHWTARSKHKDDYRKLVKSVGITARFEYLEYLQFDFYFKGKLHDASNNSYMQKLLEDSFIKEGILINDSPKYYNKIILTSNKAEHDDYCIVTFKEKDNE